LVGVAVGQPVKAAHFLTVKTFDRKPPPSPLKMPVAVIFLPTGTLPLIEGLADIECKEKRIVGGVAELANDRAPSDTARACTGSPFFDVAVTVTLAVDALEHAGALTVMVPAVAALADAGIAKTAAVAQSAAVEIRAFLFMAPRLDDLSANSPAYVQLPKEIGPRSRWCGCEARWSGLVGVAVGQPVKAAHFLTVKALFTVPDPA